MNWVALHTHTYSQLRYYAHRIQYAYSIYFINLWISILINLRCDTYQDNGAQTAVIPKEYNKSFYG